MLPGHAQGADFLQRRARPVDVVQLGREGRLREERQELRDDLQRGEPEGVQVELRLVLEGERGLRLELRPAQEELDPGGDGPVAAVPADVEVVPGAGAVLADPRGAQVGRGQVLAPLPALHVHGQAEVHEAEARDAVAPLVPLLDEDVVGVDVAVEGDRGDVLEGRRQLQEHLPPVVARLQHLPAQLARRPVRAQRQLALPLLQEAVQGLPVDARHGQPYAPRLRGELPSLAGHERREPAIIGPRGFAGGLALGAQDAQQMALEERIEEVRLRAADDLLDGQDGSAILLGGPHRAEAAHAERAPHEAAAVADAHPVPLLQLRVHGAVVRSRSERRLDCEGPAGL
mmetsp:Transcript_23773/g.70780  ORF Transcript_23773/g.70780 Transcript_23773/m.70780 type:complete len:344 (+) Transcript_23773:720-1751(+)